MRATLCVRILLVLCCSLTLATSASAECAWVLWEFSPSAGEQFSGGGHWGREGAFADRDSCVKEARKVVEKMPSVKFDDLPGGIGWRGLASIYSKRQCWPDTVDPREPKQR